MHTFLVPALETEGPAIRTWRVEGDSGSVTGITYLDLIVWRPPALDSGSNVEHRLHLHIFGCCSLVLRSAIHVTKQ